jgi:hypothetical protein
MVMQLGRFNTIDGENKKEKETVIFNYFNYFNSD